MVSRRSGPLCPALWGCLARRTNDADQSKRLLYSLPDAGLADAFGVWCSKGPQCRACQDFQEILAGTRRRYPPAAHPARVSDPSLAAHIERLSSGDWLKAPTVTPHVVREPLARLPARLPVALGSPRSAAWAGEAVHGG